MTEAVIIYLCFGAIWCWLASRGLMSFISMVFEESGPRIGMNVLLFAIGTTLWEGMFWPYYWGRSIIDNLREN